MTALAALAERTGDDLFANAARERAEALSREAPRIPALLGEMAAIESVLIHAGLAMPESAPKLDLLMRHRMASGAFRTALGFGMRNENDIPDWRDAIPVCGWQDKVYCLLAGVFRGTRRTAFSPSPVVWEVRTRVGRATYREDAETMRIEDRKGRMLYLWEKRKRWASVCIL